MVLLTPLIGHRSTVRREVGASPRHGVGVKVNLLPTIHQRVDRMPVAWLEGGGAADEAVKR